MPWAEKYRPDTLSDVVGNRDARKELLNWANTWDEHQEAAVIHGVPGVGKTTAAHALANDKQWEVMEMNASDKRTGSIVDRIAGTASQTASLFGAERKLIILDEADNLHGNSDRGGKSAMTTVIKESDQPIILVANDYYDMSRTLRNATKEIEFEPLSTTEVVDALKNICLKRGIDTTESALKKIATNADGDVRAAINDLQKNASGKTTLTDGDIRVASRDRKEEIFPFLDAVLKEDSPESVQSRSRELDMTPNDLLRWVENNIFRVYENAELASGYEALSNAEKWLGRTIRTQEYKYWRYANDQITAGVAASRDKSHGGWTRWQYPRYNSPDKTKDEICQRIAVKAGCSIATAKKEIYPFLAAMTHHCKPRELTVSVAATYDMDEGDVSKLTGSGKSTNKVQSIVADAEEKRRDFDIGGTASVSSTSTLETTESQDSSNTTEEETDSSKEQQSVFSELDGVGDSKAEELQNSGFETLADLGAATTEELTNVSGIGPTLAQSIQDQTEHHSETTDDEPEEEIEKPTEEEETDSTEPEQSSDEVADEEDESSDNQSGLQDFL